MSKHTERKRKRKEMTHFEKFVTDGNEKADELAKAGAMLDEGFMAQTGAKKRFSGNEKRCTQPAFIAWWRSGKTVEKSSHSQKKSGPSVDERREETRHRTEWCTAVSKYRCMRCGRGSEYMKMQGKCTGPKFVAKN